VKKEEENEDTLKEEYDKISKQFKDINISRIPKLSVPTIDIERMMTPIRNNLDRLVKDIARTATLNIPRIDVEGMMMPIYNNWGNMVRDISRTATLNIPIIGIENMMTQLQNNWSKQMKDISRSSAYSIRAIAIEGIMSTQIQNNLSKMLKGIDFSNIMINDNGTIDYLDETIVESNDIEEINLCISSNVSLEKKIFRIFQNIKNRHPIVIFFIITFILYPVYAYYVDCAKQVISTTVQQIQGKTKVKSDKNKIVKDIKKEVVNEFDFNQKQDINIKMSLSQFRLVKVECLNVRTTNSTNSKVIFNLKFGQVVRVINKNREWTLIEYTDDENVYINGWVFTRYISTFN